MVRSLLFFLLLSANLLAQTNWNLVWKMDQMPFQAPQTGSEMAIVKAGFDTDQDGWGEFLCAYTDLGDNYILMYEARADNTYDTVWYFKYPLPANSFAGIAVGDIDNNGKVDIVTTMPTQVNTSNPNPARLWVFEWNGVVGENKYGFYDSGTLQPTNTWNLNRPDNVDCRPYSLTIENMDDDPSNELVIGVRSGGRAGEVIVASVIGELGGFGSWVVEYNLSGLTGGSLYNVTTGDLDSDGKKEIYAFVWNFFTLYIIENTGTDQYALVDSLKAIYQSVGVDYGALESVRVTDVNNDGVKEMYIAATEPDNVVFVISNITDVSTITASDVKILYRLPVNGVPGLGTGKLRSMWVADPDADNKKNLMIGGELNGQIFDLEYKGAGSPTDSASWEHSVLFDIYAYSGLPITSFTDVPRLFYGYPANDMDKDGRNEYVFVNYHTVFSFWSNDAYVWVIEHPTATGIKDEVFNSPNGFILKQNYPNPFNPSTKIAWQTSADGWNTLKVFDIMGREVAILVNEYRSAGSYEVDFSTKEYKNSFESGVYFYQLKFGSNIDTRKMIVLK
ncbi:MAG: T9SS type A sorting domain-containing protein [Ignavibacteriaceae bacterium]|nr:T9SS type A sorting domain-containing protein [Ignavibacteriaceae bacterium]